MTVFRGSITIDSAILSTSSPPLPIFAPSTHSLPTIRAIRAPSSSSTSSTVSAPKAFKLPFTLQILDDLDFPIVISLQSLQTGIEGIESICRLAGMPLPQGGMWQVPSRWNTSSVPQDVQNDTYRILLQPERDLCATVVPHTWHEALSNMPSSDTSAGQVPSCIIQGPKGVGKSTFSKLLVNTLLSRYVASPSPNERN
jgi:polynucleotide 5'-hydroxyl-kinase GRC3/NOL9